ncbi:MAG: hypothetical protein IJZ04_02950 [Clostridia bacterium]|nr:hypothetical protein [Clostridia bacterium]
MYCVKCGVELSSGQRKCPICETKVYHPDFITDEGGTYPKKDTPPDKFDRKGLMFIFTMVFIIPFILCLVCDLSIHHTVIWSGYASGAIALAYIMVVLPLWFRRPNPVIFVSCDFAGVLLYLLYVDLATQGGWFLPFALPVVGMIALIIITCVTLKKYVRRGHLYIYGGAIIATGVLTVLIELLIGVVFDGAIKFVWSIYPLISLFIIGMMLIVIAICKPLRMSLKKKFFL